MFGKGSTKEFSFLVDERLRKRKAPFFEAVRVNLREAQVSPQLPGEGRNEFNNRCRYRPSKIDLVLMSGGHMEKIAEELKMVNEEVAEAKSVLQSLFNELSAVSAQTTPLIQDQVAKIRSVRMSTVTEVQASLVALRDVRKFFLESDYEKEIKRLGDFVALCKELKTLKEDGTLDALCDTALRLALPGERGKT